MAALQASTSIPTSETRTSGFKPLTASHHTSLAPSHASSAYIAVDKTAHTPSSASRPTDAVSRPDTPLSNREEQLHGTRDTAQRSPQDNSHDDNPPPRRLQGAGDRHTSGIVVVVISSLFLAYNVWAHWGALGEVRARVVVFLNVCVIAVGVGVWVV